MKVSYRWLQTYFNEPLPEAEALAELLTFHAFEVEGVEQVGDDSVIDIDVLANRSSDCLSHRGIARELATLLGRPFENDPFDEPLPNWPDAPHFEARVDDHDQCTRHMAAIVRGVTVGPSPAWLKQKLESIGQRSINNIVDVTNFVMHDLGQPVHVFDLDKIEMHEGTRAIAVTNAVPGEVVSLLGGETRTLDERDLVIRDTVSGSALDIAGIKGGTIAELTDATTDIVIDCANFNYISIRKTSRRLGLSTDASVRFQNEPSAHLPAFALRDTIKHILDLAGGELLGVSDTFRVPARSEPVTVSLSEINGLLGTALTVAEIEAIFVRFEFEFSLNGEVFTVSPPWERTDLRISADLIEEIGRVYGYGTLAGVLPEKTERPALNKRFYYEEKLRHTLVDLGYSEVYTYTLRDRGDVELLNPLASDKGFLRSTLALGVREALERNTVQAPLLGLESVKLFELGTVFTKDGEYTALALGMRSGGKASVQAMLERDIETLAGVLGASLTGTVEDGIYETPIGKLLPTLPEPSGYLPPLPYDAGARFSPWSVYPFVLRDVAVWVPEGVPAAEVAAVIVSTASDLLVRYDPFDEFTKDGRTSRAFHLVFQSYDRTLNDAEVGKEMAAIEQALRDRGFEVR